MAGGTEVIVSPFFRAKFLSRATASCLCQQRTFDRERRAGGVVPFRSQSRAFQQSAAVARTFGFEATQFVSVHDPTRTARVCPPRLPSFQKRGKNPCNRLPQTQQFSAALFLVQKRTIYPFALSAKPP